MTVSIVVEMRGIGHRSRTVVLARDPASDASASSGFQFRSLAPAAKMKSTPVGALFISSVEMRGIEPRCI